MKPRLEFPEIVVCIGMPSLDGKTVELRPCTEEDEPSGPDFTVSVDDMTWVNLPIPELHAPGLALTLCRIEERHPGFLILAVPALSGADRISVPPENLAKRHHRPQS